MASHPLGSKLMLTRSHEEEKRTRKKYPLVKSLSTSTNAVKGGLSKGKVLGAGCSFVAAVFLVDDPIVVPPPLPTTDVMEELRRRCKEAEVQGGGGRKRIETDPFLRTSTRGALPVESHPSLATSLLSAGSSTATGLLVQLEMMHTPA
ncbi:hypothetical protein LIER_30387 [Lithospermum erythrorhizon]|uniref:Uncharacterized protein n=1 Tax=Lithospermum erythrorhizon TaxID=34254 RepID=A0AAV3RPP6_LITER